MPKQAVIRLSGESLRALERRPIIRDMNSTLPGDTPYTDYPLPESLCYLNGQFGRVCDTQVSVMDRGFIFGDGVYEVLPAYNSQVFCFEEHMARLDRSLKELRIPNPLDRAEWQAIARRLIDDLKQTTGAAHQLIYIQVTRGVAPARPCDAAGPASPRCTSWPAK